MQLSYCAVPAQAELDGHKVTDDYLLVYFLKGGSELPAEVMAMSGQCYKQDLISYGCSDSDCSLQQLKELSTAVDQEIHALMQSSFMLQHFTALHMPTPDMAVVNQLLQSFGLTAVELPRAEDLTALVRSDMLRAAVTVALRRVATKSQIHNVETPTPLACYVPDFLPQPKLGTFTDLSGKVGWTWQ